MHMPDTPYLKWRYELGADEVKKTRDNPTQFIQAAKKCLKWLDQFVDGQHPWDDQAPAMKAIHKLISIKENDSEKRINRWKNNSTFKHFISLFGGNKDYDKFHWRRQALESSADNKHLEFEKLGRDVELKFKPKANFDTSSFRQFHRATKMQRAFILEKLFW